MLLLYGRFIDQHDRNVIADRVNPPASGAFETGAIGLQLEIRLVQRTHKNIKEFFADRHADLLV